VLKNITLGQFFPGNTLVHRMDPRFKLVMVFAFIVLVFFAKTFVCYGIIILYLALVIGVSKIPVKYFLRGLKPIVFIIALTFVLNVFMTPGEHVLFAWRFIRVTLEGLRSAIYLSVRLMLLIIGTQVLTLTTSPVSLTDGLEDLMRPLSKIGFPSHELAMMTTIAMRFIPTLLEETNRIMKAQMSRGADFESGNLFRRARNLVPLMVPLFVSAFRRADDLALAMEARCYRGGEGRTRMKVLKATRADLYAAISFLLLTALIVADNILAV